MKDRGRRLDELLEKLGPIQLARLAVVTSRDAVEAALTDATPDRPSEASAIGRRASTLCPEERTRYAAAVQDAFAVQRNAVVTAPIVGALAVLQLAATRGAAGWSLFGECVALLDLTIAALREAASPSTATGDPADEATMQAVADAVSAGQQFVAGVSEVARGEAEALCRLATAAESQAHTLADLMAGARETSRAQTGVDPIPVPLAELLALAGKGGVPPESDEEP